MDTFLSCDWGTSAFRLRLITVDSFTIAAEEVSGEGIASTYEKWNAAGGNENTRIAFFQDVINRHICKLEAKLGSGLTRTPVILSGMASSSIGMLPLPYGKLPLAGDASGLVYKYLKQTSGFEHDVFVISGLRSSDDVMRGEETQLIGCLIENRGQGRVLYIFPGTHSKHIEVNKGEIIDFKTFMTGEFFDLLAWNSILSDSVSAPGNIDESPDLQSFCDGVLKARQNCLLNSLFNVRAGYLLDQRSKKANYFYLSGLLIGTELLSIQQSVYDEVILCCSETLKTYYLEAAMTLAINNFNTSEVSAEQAVIRGQYFVYKYNCRDERIFVG